MDPWQSNWEVGQNEYKGRVRPHKYSSLAIETVLFIRLLFKLPLRQTEGFISSLFQLMNLDLDVPDHSTLSRRSQTLNPKIRCYGKIKGPIHIGHDISMVNEREEAGESYI